MNVAWILCCRGPTTIGALAAEDHVHGVVEPVVIRRAGAAEHIEPAKDVEVPPRRLMQPRELRTDRPCCQGMAPYGPGVVISPCS